MCLHYTKKIKFATNLLFYGALGTIMSELCHKKQRGLVPLARYFLLIGFEVMCKLVESKSRDYVRLEQALPCFLPLQPKK